MALDKKYIEMLDNCLAKYCQAMYQRMQLPLERGVIEAYFNKWQIADEKLMDIFLWKNGIENDGTLPTLAYDYTGFGVMPTLQDIDEFLQLEYESGLWRSSFFPLVSSFGGDFLLYESNRENKEHGMLFLQCPTFGNVGEFVVSYFDSLEKMIETINDCFSNNAFIYNSTAMRFTQNHSLVTQISRKNNPLSEYWQNRWHIQ